MRPGAVGYAATMSRPSDDFPPVDPAPEDDVTDVDTGDDDALADAMSRQSFPTSDPPSTWAGADDVGDSGSDTE